MDPVFTQVPSFKESRLASLFADFSHLKDTNPEGYEANVAAWEALLLQCLRIHTFHSSIALPANMLSNTLASPQYGQPKALPLVISILVEKQVLVPWSIYKTGLTVLSSYADFFSPQKLWQKLYSSLNLSFYKPKIIGDACSDYYLHWPTLTSRALEILTCLEKKADKQGCYSARLLNFQMFHDLLNEIDKNLSYVDIEAILIYLYRDTGSLGVQIAKGPEKSSFKYFIKVGNDKLITQEDQEIIKLKVNIGIIENRVAILERMIDHDIPARLAHLLSNNAPDDRLKNVLRRKAHFAKSLDSELSVLNKLTFILSKIDEARSNEAIYDSLQSAKSVLLSFNQRVSLASLEDLSTELDDQMALTDEISDAIGVSSHWNEEEISAELKTLEKEHELSIKTKENKDNLEDKPVELPLKKTDNQGENSKISEKSKPAFLKKTEQQNEISKCSEIDKLMSLKLQNLSIAPSQSEELEKSEEIAEDDYESTKEKQGNTPLLV